MLFTIGVCFFWGSILSFFVIAPLRIRFKIIFSMYFLALICTLLFSCFSFAKEKIKDEDLVPPPFILAGTGNWLPSVHQYILVPLQGKVQVQYVGLFVNSFHAKGTTLELPLPQGFSDLKIKINKNEKSISAKDAKIQDVSLVEGINEIDAEFYLESPKGTASWKAGTLSTLPGVTLIMMSDAGGVHFEHIPKDFQSHPNPPAQQLIRMTTNQMVNFPQFTISGILPKRSLLIYPLLAAFAFILFASSVLFLSNKKK